MDKSLGLGRGLSALMGDDTPQVINQKSNSIPTDSVCDISFSTTFFL